MALTILFTFASCQQKLDDSSALTTVTINLSGISDSNAKSLTPSTITSPDRYKLTLTQVTSSNGTWNPTGKTYSGTFDNTSILQISDVEIGNYNVSVLGYSVVEQVESKIMTGSSTSQFLVSPSGTNSVTIPMELISDEDGLTGSIQVTFNWADAASNSFIASAMANAGLSFQLFLEENGSMTSFGNAASSGPNATSYTFTLSGIPVTKGTIAYFRVYDTAEQTLLVDNFLSTALQVYAGQTSTPDSNEPLVEGAIVLPVDAVVNAKNVKNVAWDYNEATPLSAVDISWDNIMSRGVNQIKYVTIKYWPTAEPASSISVDSTTMTQDAGTTSGKFTLSGLSENVEYQIAIQAHYFDSKVSTLDTQYFAKQILTKSMVTGIVIDTTNLPSEGIVYADQFTLSAAVQPAAASVKTFTWSVSDTDILTRSENTFTANKPGSVTITATSTDKKADGNQATQTTSAITVLLQTPANVVAASGSDSINLNWGSVPFASSYQIYRSVNAGEYKSFANTTNTNYVDTKLNASKSYAYHVVAVADNTAYNSKPSANTTAITPVVPTITVEQPTLTGQTLVINTEDELYVSETKSITLRVPAEIEGATSYAWLLNASTTLKTGTWNDGLDHVIIDYTTNGLDNTGIGKTANTLMLVTTDAEGKKYAKSLTFYLVENVPVTGIEWITTTDRVETTDADGFTMKAQTIPSYATNTAVTYSTSDATIATVDETTGVVKALANGSVTITAKTTDGSFTTTHDIDIVIPVTSLSMNKTEGTLFKDSNTGYNTTTLTATTNTGAKYPTVTWVSSNPAVASVSDGVVTSLGSGTATITATSVDNPSVTATYSLSSHDADIYLDNSIVTGQDCTTTGTGGSGNLYTFNLNFADSFITESNYETSDYIIDWYLFSDKEFTTTGSAGIRLRLTDYEGPIAILNRQANLSTPTLFVRVKDKSGNIIFTLSTNPKP